jgi:hypothetical protein
MTALIGIRVWSQDGAVCLAVLDETKETPTVEVTLTPMQARELARVVRNAADFVAAAGKAEGNA